MAAISGAVLKSLSSTGEQRICLLRQCSNPISRKLGSVQFQFNVGSQCRSLTTSSSSGSSFFFDFYMLIICGFWVLFRIWGFDYFFFYQEKFHACYVNGFYFFFLIYEILDFYCFWACGLCFFSSHILYCYLENVPYRDCLYVLFCNGDFRIKNDAN